MSADASARTGRGLRAKKPVDYADGNEDEDEDEDVNTVSEADERQEEERQEEERQEEERQEDRKKQKTQETEATHYKWKKVNVAIPTVAV